VDVGVRGAVVVFRVRLGLDGDLSRCEGGVGGVGGGVVVIICHLCVYGGGGGR